jgi:diketogulonate reductase-like aldo/keto reductase
MVFKKLSNGFELPYIVLGTFDILQGEVTKVINYAYSAGYRALDTAWIYENEDPIGGALNELGIAKDMTIISKLWNDMHGYDDALRAFDRSEKSLGKIDVFLIHWPDREFISAWKALERIYEEGRVRAIGVSNFLTHHLEELMEHVTVMPMINQIETHAYFMDLDTIGFCNENDIAVQAWGPLMRTGNMLEDKDINRIGESHGKTAAQVALRYLIQKGIIVLPKSTKQHRIVENISILDFELSKQELETMERLNIGKRVGPHPDEFLDVYTI